MISLPNLSRHSSLLALGILMSVVGCASEASVEGMTVSAPVSPAIETPDKIEEGISIRSVTGGEDTNPMWTSEVGNEEFHAALESSLRNNSLLAREPTGKYALDAELINVNQPLFGFDTEVTSTVRYRLDPADQNEEAYEDVVTESYTATTSDSWYGVERLRLANEGSIRSNIQAFIDRLIESYAR